MRDHISTVVGRYKGKIHGWDVVNEAIDEDGSTRKSPWQIGIGDDYVARALEFAARGRSGRRAVLQRLQSRKARETRWGDQARAGSPGGKLRIDGIGNQARVEAPMRPALRSVTNNQCWSSCEPSCDSRFAVPSNTGPGSARIIHSSCALVEKNVS